MREMPKRIQMVYQDALKNIAFIKRQQWTVRRNAVAAYAALIWVANHIKAECADQAFLSVLVASVGIYGSALLWTHKKGLKKFRDRVSWIYANEFEPKEQDGLKLPTEKNDDWIISWLIVAVGVAAVVAGLAIWLPFD